jgi:putative ABC transport system permease protein
MFEDVSYGLRSMVRNPGLTATAVLTLALGIGANTAMFSVVNAVLLRPLPYRDPDRLVTIRAQIPHLNIYGAFVEYNTYGDWWRARSRSFEALSAFSPGSANLTLGNEPERVATCRVNAGFLAVAGIHPALGRDFLPEEDQPGAPRVAIVSDSLWKRRFGGDRTLIGRQIVLDRNTYTVVGILRPGFDLYGADTALYMPIAASTARVPGMPSVGVFARLKSGVTVRTAQAEIDELCRGWVGQYHYPKDWGARVWRVRDFAVRDVRSSVLMLSVAVGLVLLIACANVANLLLARAGPRQREMAIRSALGASGGRIVRQLLTESAVLAAIAGAIGLLAAWAGVRALAAGPVYLPFQKTASIDLPVLWFSLGAALVTTLLFGLAPSLAIARAGLAADLKEGGRGGGEGLGRSRFRSALVIAEVALSLLLVIGATLTARSLVRLQAVDPGFHPEGVLAGYLTLPSSSYAEPARRASFVKALIDRLERIPGVAAAGAVSHLPFSNAKSGSGIVVEGAPPPQPGERMIVFERTADPQYFQAIGARLMAGRLFDAHDPPGHPVAIINQTMARRCWPKQDAVGKRFGDGRPDHWMTVVGVIADLRQTSLADEPDAESYVPFPQSPVATMALVVRTTGDPLRLAPATRAAVRELDQELPISGVAALADSLSQSTRPRRFSVLLLGSFALLAMILATVGIYGVISYSVTRRTHEIGIRLALGAERGRIQRMVVGRALIYGSAGVAIGVAGGLALTRLLRSMLYDVSATDPAVFAAASLFLLAIAALAGYVPARRAARTDPCVALRNE